MTTRTWTQREQTQPLGVTGASVAWRKIGGARGATRPYLIKQRDARGLVYGIVRFCTVAAANAFLDALLGENDALTAQMEQRINQCARHAWTDRDDEDWATMTGIYSHDREAYTA